MRISRWVLVGFLGVAGCDEVPAKVPSGADQGAGDMSDIGVDLGRDQGGREPAVCTLGTSTLPCVVGGAR